MQDTENKVEAKIDNLQQILSKEIQNLKLKQAEMPNTITEIKNSLEVTNSRIQEAQEWVSEGGGQTTVKQKRAKRLKTNEESLREHWDNVKHTTSIL